MEIKEGLLFANRYRLHERKGRGSFGEVWLATDEELDLDVAIKIYIALDNKGLAEFKSEYKTAFNLNHPNLLHAYYFGEWSNQPYLVMPYCPESSAMLIGKISEDELWRFLRDVASGLSYLHEQGIVHRDIKPDNVLRSPEGDFLITDFGVSRKMRSTLRRYDAATRQMASNDLAGAVGYMGPECFSANPESVFATDVWALAATCIELLSGEMPFMGQGGIMLLRGAEMPTMKGYSQELNDTLHACLSLEPDNRPSAKEIKEYAQAMCEHQPTIAPWKAKGKTSQPAKNKTVIIVAVVALIMTLGVIGLTALLRTSSGGESAEDDGAEVSAEEIDVPIVDSIIEIVEVPADTVVIAPKKKKTTSPTVVNRPQKESPAQPVEVVQPVREPEYVPVANNKSGRVRPNEYGTNFLFVDGRREVNSTFMNSSSYVQYNVETDQGNYEIHDLPEWCRVEKRTERSFRVRYEKNVSGHKRHFRFRVTAGDNTVLIYVTQN